MTAASDDFDKRIKIDRRSDGIYIIISNPPGIPTISRKDIITIIEDLTLQDIDFTAINEIFKDSEILIEKKISSNPIMTIRNEKAVIETSRDKMEAYISFAKPGFLGTFLEKEDIHKAISNAGVRFGINEDTIDKLVFDKKYGTKYLFAEGIPAVDGINGYLEYKFDTEKKNSAPKPKIQDDGKVDFHTMSWYEQTLTDEELIIAIPPIPGKDGFNVLQQTISHRPGKDAPKLPLGKNVRAVGNDDALVANINGIILYENGKVSVSPVLEIKGDVGPVTGHIQFKGSVVVHQNVLTGFNIDADDTVEVLGMVEGAAITSGSDISIFGGIQGADRAVINAKGNIVIKFVESATLIARENIYAGSIMHSKIQCGEDLVIDGKLSTLVGGKIYVGQNIRANKIGSPMATLTEITVGSAPEVIDSYSNAKEKLESLQQEYKELSAFFDKLSTANEKRKLDEKNRNILIKTIHSKQHVRETISAIQQKISDEMLPFMGSYPGIIYASKVIHSGVHVMVGNAILHIKDDIKQCLLRNENGKILIEPYQ